MTLSYTLWLTEKKIFRYTELSDINYNISHWQKPQHSIILSSDQLNIIQIYKSKLLFEWLFLGPDLLNLYVLTYTTFIELVDLNKIKSQIYKKFPELEKGSYKSELKTLDSWS